MTKKIVKFGSNLDLAIKPKPSKEYIPEWYKKAPFWKSCSPFLDSFLTGYTLELWQDIEVIKLDGQNLTIKWDENNPAPINHRDPEVTNNFPKAGMDLPTSEYETIHFTWNSPYAMQTPKGYSLLITHPLNRLDLPFTTLSGVIDADVQPISDGALPFFFKKDFQGVIKKGTPIAQVIPFKRENWELNMEKEVYDKAKEYSKANKLINIDFYRKFLWTKKSYL
jgi:hypothetical protein